MYNTSSPMYMYLRTYLPEPVKRQIIKVIRGRNRMVDYCTPLLKKHSRRVYNFLLTRYRDFAVPPFYYGLAARGDENYAVLIHSMHDAQTFLAGVRRSGTSCTIHVICSTPTTEHFLKTFLRSRYCKIEYITLEEFAAHKVQILVLLSRDHEEETEKKLRDLYFHTGHNFTIYDHYAASHISLESCWRKYRDVELYVYPSVLFPTLYSNWDYLNYLATELKDKPPLDILDMFAGSGVIGLCVKKEMPQHRVSFCDVNFWAVKSIRKTMQQHPEHDGKVYLSEALEGMPEDTKFDVIVGNPPHIDVPQTGPDLLAGADPAFEAHHMFFSKVAKHLKPGGKMIFIESLMGIYENFYLQLEQNYPQFKLGKRIPLPQHICYIQEIELA